MTSSSSSIQAIGDLGMQLQSQLQNLKRLSCCPPNFSDALIITLLLSRTNSGAYADRVVQFLSSPGALEGALCFLNHRETTLEDVKDFDVGSYVDMCNHACQQETLRCASNQEEEPRFDVHVQRLERYTDEVLEPMVTFLSTEIVPALATGAANWKYPGGTELRQSPVFDGCSVAVACELIRGSLQRTMTDEECRRQVFHDKTLNTLSSLSVSLSQFALHFEPTAEANERPSLPRCMNLIEREVLSASQISEEVSRYLNEVVRVRPSPLLANEGDGWLPYVASLVEGCSEMRTLMTSCLQYISDKVQMELSFVSSTRSMVRACVERMKVQDENSRVRKQLAAMAISACKRITDEEGEVYAALMSQCQTLSSTILSRQKGLANQQSLWWEDASDDERETAMKSKKGDDEKPPLRTTSLALLLSRAFMNTTIRRRFAGAPCSASFLQTLKATAIYAAYHYISSSSSLRHVQSVDMKEILCSLLDTWTEVSAQARWTATDDVATGEQTMRDIALVIHMLLHKYAWAAPISITSTPPDHRLLITCSIPQSDATARVSASQEGDAVLLSDDAECELFWYRLYQALWFHVDPLGQMNGGYLLPTADRNRGISPLNHHSFGFLPISAIHFTPTTTTASTPSVIFVFDTRLVMNDSRVLSGMSVEHVLKEIRASKPTSSEQLSHSAAFRIDVLRKVVYCFAKLEKHALLFKDHVHPGFASSLNEIATPPVTEMVVLWTRNTSSLESGNQGPSIAYVGLIPPPVVACHRRYPCPDTPKELSESVMAQLALTIQRIGRFAHPSLSSFIDASEAILEAVLVGDPDAGPDVRPPTVADLLHYIDELKSKFSYESIVPAHSQQEDRCNATPLREVPEQVGSMDDAPQNDELVVLNLTASRKTWHMECSPLARELPELSSRINADANSVVVRSMMSPSMESAFSAQLNDEAPIAPARQVSEVIKAPTDVAQIFSQFAQTLLSTNGQKTKRVASPLRTYHASSPSPKRYAPMHTYILKRCASSDISDITGSLVVPQQLQHRLRECINLVGQRSRLPDLHVSINERIVVFQFVSDAAISKLLQLPSITGKENAAHDLSDGKWVLFSKASAKSTSIVDHLIGVRCTNR